ncbi:hypothetical protein FHY18_001444 [Xanthomonas arboricola]|nr:hypothetical protein [Xanthomonas sp. 3793]
MASGVIAAPSGKRLDANGYRQLPTVGLSAPAMGCVRCGVVRPPRGVCSSKPPASGAAGSAPSLLAPSSRVEGSCRAITCRRYFVPNPAAPADPSIHPVG